MPSYSPNSSRFGSTMIMRTSFGVDLNRIDMISEFSITDLPEPVEPATSRWGIVSSVATLMRPLMSLPSATVSGDAEPVNSSDSSIWRRLITSRFRFGTSMPTVDLPGMRSIMIDSALRPRHRSSVSVVMREYFTPASGLNSKVVTTGPGLICAIDPRTLNSSNFDLISAAVCLSSRLSHGVRSSGCCSKWVRGRRNSVRRRGSSYSASGSTSRPTSSTSGGGSNSRIGIASRSSSAASSSQGGVSRVSGGVGA